MSYVEDRLQEIADAIREKEGSIDPIPAPDFASRILDIQTGVDTSDATATAADILERKTAYVNGVKIRGTMENIGAATPSITVEPTTGIVTATTDQKRGFVDAAQKSASKQLDTQAGKTVTPSTIARTAVARGLYTTGDVLVAGEPNLIPSNIKAGVSIFGVVGTYTG